METKIDKAIELFKKREYSKAIDEFSKVLETEPDNAEIYNNMALGYMNLNNLEKDFSNKITMHILKMEVICGLL